MSIAFRDLKAEEVECRVSQIFQNGCILLLYKDARADMAVLDEVVGAENWQRSHELINGNLFCNVGIRVQRSENSFGGEWIWKQDVGTESYTEKEKGQASDSFKRACVNWGIGRELYTAPFIWVKAEYLDIKDKNGKPACNTKFKVSDLKIVDKKITGLAIQAINGWDAPVTCYVYGDTKEKLTQQNNVIIHQPQAQPQPIICPKCNKPVKPSKRNNGTIATPEEVMKGCGGMCYSCYQKAKQA